ncbi:MAG: hypothetical protein U0166_15875 [Acidobacteriota bacterium]
MKPAGPLLAAAAAAIVSLPTMSRGISLGDEGHLLAIASRIAHGDGVLYRDIATNIPPLSYGTLAAAFRLFGETIQVERALGLACAASAAAACFVLGVKSGGRLSGTLAVIAFLGMKGIAFPHWNVFYYTECSVMLALWALAVLPRDSAPGSRVVLAAGTLCALSAGYKQNFGAFVLIAAGLHLFRLGARRSIGLFLAPAILLGAAIAGWFAARGAIGPFFDWNVLYFLRRFASDLSIPYPRFFGPLWPDKPSEVAFFYYLPGSLPFPRSALLVRILYAVPIVTLLTLLRRLRDPLALFALLSLSAVFPLADASHYLDALLPAAIAAACSRRRTAAVVVATLLAMGGATAGVTAIERNDADLTFRERGHVRVPRPEADDLSRIGEALARDVRPGDPILCLPYCPLFYFTGPYRNPTPLYLPFPSLLDDATEERMLRDAGAARAIVLDGARWPHLPPFEASAPRIAGWTREAFEPCAEAGTLSLLCRR